MHDLEAFEFSYAQWLKQVERDLKGADFDKKLVTKLPGGLSLNPLYTRDHLPEGEAAEPGMMPFTRGATRRAGKRWRVAQIHNAFDLKTCNGQILEDLACGVEAINLEIASPTQTGIGIDSLDDLKACLKDVAREAIYLNIRAHENALGAAVATLALTAENQSHIGHLGLDPLGILERTGALKGGLEQNLKAMGLIAQYCTQNHAQARSILVDGSALHGNGASLPQLLAYMVAKGVDYLRALTDAGLSIAEANGQLAFLVPTGVEQFPEIALLRALRTLWAAVMTGCGLEGSAAAPMIFAETAERSQTRLDPWVNMLRNTVSTFSAAVGGADQIAVRPFDSSVGESNRLGRRVARNTQWVLAEESHLAFVQDPAGGSYFVEHLTAELEAEAWALFQGVEAAGGYAKALSDGLIQGALGKTRAGRERRIQQRKMPITGVSEFANLDESPLERQGLQHAKPREFKPLEARGIEALIKAAKDGASFAALTQALIPDAGETRAQALTLYPLAQGFENLRERSAALQSAGKAPRVYLANLGRRAQNIHRATWVRNFFAAGGISAEDPEGFTQISDLIDAFKATGMTRAVICSSDAVYATLGLEAAKALRAAGASRIYVAGRPGALKDEWAALGIDGFIYMGCDVYTELDAALSEEEGK